MPQSDHFVPVEDAVSSPNSPKKFDEKYERMIGSPVEGLVCRLAGPSIVTMMISAIYNMADTYFVSSLGTSAVGGVGVVFPLMAIIQAIGFFFGHGTGNYVSRQLGAMRLDDASKMVATGFVSALICGVAVTILGLAFVRPLALFLGATETILPYAVDYARFILIGVPWMTASLTLNNLLRFQGSSFYGMIGMVSGAVLNIVLDPIFIFVLGMGVSGASLATMISQFVGFCLLLVGCTRQGNIRIEPRKFSPSVAAYREIVRGGTPSLCRQSISSISTICINRFAGGYGDAAIAAISIVQRVIMFSNSALVGFGQGFQPVCGFNYGAARYDRVRRAFSFCVRISTGLLSVLGVAAFIFAPQVIAIFRADDPDVIAIGALSLRLSCPTFPLMGWITINNMMLQTIGKSLRASMLALSRQGLFLLPILFFLAPRLGLLGIQLSQPIANVATFILSIPLGVGVLREMSAQFKADAGCKDEPVRSA